MTGSVTRNMKDIMKWLNYWNVYWFPKTTTLYLSISRVVVVATQLFWFFPSLEYQINLLEKNREFIDPQLFILTIAAIIPRDIFFTPVSFTVLYWVTLLAGVTSLSGLFTRASVFIFALGNWILISHAYSYADIHHPEAIICIFLMLLAFSPSGRSLSIDALIYHYRNRFSDNSDKASGMVETAVWPLKLVHVLLASAYFSTGLSKLLYGGLKWMNGYTLQSYIFQDAIRRDLPIGIWIAQQHTFCIILSVSTILFELFFFISLIIPCTAPFFLIGGVFFHMGLYLLAGHDFFQHIVLLLLLAFFALNDAKLGQPRGSVFGLHVGTQQYEQGKYAKPLRSHGLW
jgi:Vitamin K-dependent gamma-carboxylase